MPTINELTAASGAAPGTLVLPGYDGASATPRTRKWTLSALLAALTAPNFTTLRVASGATVSRLLKGAGTVSLSSLASGAEATSTFTLSGAAVGDVIYASPVEAPTAGVIFTAWVSDTDQVSIRARNLTAGAVTAEIDMAFVAVRA